MDKIKIKEKVLSLITEAEAKIPKTLEEDLPTTEYNHREPGWHKYEHEIWELGEEIRQLLKQDKGLYKDQELLERIISICLNRNSKRGRQSFIMLLWNKSSNHYAERLVTQLNDKFVYGHIIEGLNKMKVSGFSDLVRPFCVDKTTWIKNQAKKYITQYGG